MRAISRAHAEKAQPWDTCVCGFGYRAGHVEMKHGFRACARFRDPSPARITTASRAVSARAVPNEINACVLFVRWPMLLKIVQERRPILRETVLLEILQRKRKTVVNAYQRGDRLGYTLDEPLGNLFATPVPARAGRRRDFVRLGCAVRQVDAQALEAGLTRFSPGVINPDIPLKSRAHIPTAIVTALLSQRLS